MAATLLLTKPGWDLSVDGNGNIALANDPYSALQDVASACRTLYGECWIDQTKGIRYFERILGRQQPLPILRQQLTQAAETVPTVVSAVAVITDVVNREARGEVRSVLSDGSSAVTTL